MVHFEADRSQDLIINEFYLILGKIPKFSKFFKYFFNNFKFSRDFAYNICYFFLHLFDKKFINKYQTERKILKVKFYQKIQDRL